MSLKHRNRALITIMSVAGAWLIATIVFAILVSTSPASPAWLAYVFAMPASCIVWLVFNCIWGRRRLNFIIVSLLLWTFILSTHLTAFVCAEINIWVLFIVGIPIQFIVAFLPGIGLFRYSAERNKK